MLKQRIITALVMLAGLLPSVFYPNPMPFGLVSLTLIAAGAWEWGKLNGLSATASLGAGVVCAIACSVAWSIGILSSPLFYWWLSISCIWVLAGTWLLRSGASAWSRVPQIVRLVGGLVALVAAWIAVMQARVAGINYLFSVLVLVWVADIGAYFAGRALGGRLFVRKLAPSISPGKTWEGAMGGMACVVITALVWRSMDASLGVQMLSIYSQLSKAGVTVLIVGVLFLGAMSVVGDLVESLFKRAAGVKDSSGLLPGHGGVLDRLDALLPTLPMALMLTSLVS